MVVVQSKADAIVLRRKFALEAVAPLLWSPLADAGTRALATRLLCRAAAVPSCAKDLVVSAGSRPLLAVLH